jgi:hypothetical protein
MYVYIYAFIYICIHVYMYVYIYIYIYIYTYKYMYKYTYTYTYIGTDVAATVFKGGVETPTQRGGFLVSVQGNAVSGTFILNYRGYQTMAIDFDASNTQMQTR